MALSTLFSGRARVYRPGFFARLFTSRKWKLTLDPKASGRVRLSHTADVDLRCLDIVSTSTSKALLWHTVEIRSRGGTETLSGLTGDAAAQIGADLHAFINAHLFGLIGSETDRLQDIDTKLREITDGNRQYLAQADLGRAIDSVPGNAAAALAHPLLDAALMPEKLKSALPVSFAMLTDKTVRHRYNEAFVSAELLKFQPFFDDLDGRSLSDQQREACIRLEDNNLLIASAGSGKSATMVGKVAYVLEKQLYRPDEILVLAFNKNAADELKARIARQLQVEEEALACRVTTFHALGRGIIQEIEGRPPQLANWVDHPAGETKVLEEIIRGLIDRDPEFGRLWIDLLVLHPKADIPAEVFDTDADFRRYTSDRLVKGQATIGSLAGVIVKSLQEQQIVNWLWLHSVAFEYERQIAVQDDDGVVRHVHPDFYYPLTGAVHEHFALNADGTSPFEDYSTHAESKRQAYRRQQLDFFETTSKGNRRLHYGPTTNDAIVDAAQEAVAARGDWKTIRALLEKWSKLGGRYYHMRERLVDEDGLCAINDRKIQRVLHDMNRYVHDFLEYGPDYAERKYMHVIRQVRPTAPLFIVDVDHSTLDMTVFDHEFPIAFGRPDLLLFRDRFSGVIIGYSISFNSPSYATFLDGLRHMMFEKDPASGSGFAYPWWGRPLCLGIDNAKHLLGINARAAAQELGFIPVAYRPGRPWEKGALERLFGILGMRITHRLPGSTESKPENRDDYDDEKDMAKPILSLQELKGFLDYYFSYIHHRQPTQGLDELASLQGIPADMWEQEIANAPQAPLLDPDIITRLAGDVGTVAIRGDSIQWDHIIYTCAELLVLTTNPGHIKRGKYNARRNPSDLGSIDIEDPYSKPTRWIKVPVCDAQASYANGLRLHVHRAIVKHKRERASRQIAT